MLTVAFWKKTRERLSIIFCSLSFCLFCIDLLMMYDRSICANCNFRWEHLPLSKLLLKSFRKSQTIVCKKLWFYARGRGDRLVYTVRAKDSYQAWFLLSQCKSGEKKEIILMSGFVRKCLCMYLEWYKRIWLSQQLK